MDKAVIKKRNRPTLVCFNCKRRKTKCDRVKPVCGNCAKANEVCIYSDTGFKPVKKLKFEYIREFGFDEYVDLAPNGLTIISKRSATWFNGLCSPYAMSERDEYLKLMDVVTAILTKIARKGSRGKTHEIVLKLPESLKTINVYNKSASTENQLHYKIAKSISTARSAAVGELYLPEEGTFWATYFTYFENVIHPMTRIFDLKELRTTITTFFESQRQNSGILSEKTHDHDILMIIYVIINLYLLEFDPHSIVIQNHINLIKHKLTQFKWFQKATVLQLRSWMLFRFHNWCTYHDNDGNRLTSNDGLMGLIMGQSNSLGINWHLWTKLENDEYKNIWVNIIHWDRKVALLNGREPLNSITMKIPEATYEYDIMRILRLLLDDSNHVNYTKVHDIIENIDWGNGHDIIKWEWNVILKTIILILEHGRLCQMKNKMERTLRALEDLIEIWNKHFEEPLLPKAYTNRVIEISMNKAINILPGLILRTDDLHKKSLLLDMMDNICSTYFNEFSYYYYVFKRLFRYKLWFKLVGKEDSLANILQILKDENNGVFSDLGIVTEEDDVKLNNLSTMWNNRFKCEEDDYIPTTTMNCKKYESNLFSTSYRHALEKLETEHNSDRIIDITQFLQDVLDTTDLDLFREADPDNFLKGYDQSLF